MKNLNKNLSKRYIVEQYIAFYNSFNIDAMMELFTDDCIFQDVNNSRGISECKGKDELRNVAHQSAQIFSHRQQIVLNWVIDENKIAVEIDYAATLALDLPNGLKKGDEISLKGVSIYEFRDGQIKRLIDFS